MKRLSSKSAQNESINNVCCLDFDGVCVKYNGKDIDKIGIIMDGFKDFIKWAKDNDFELVIHSARNDNEIKQWLKDNHIEDINVSFGKPLATWYVDDRAVRFTGDFEQLKKDIMTTRPWWQKTNTSL